MPQEEVKTSQVLHYLHLVVLLAYGGVVLYTQNEGFELEDLMINFVLVATSIIYHLAPGLIKLAVFRQFAHLSISISLGAVVVFTIMSLFAEGHTVQVILMYLFFIIIPAGVVNLFFLILLATVEEENKQKFIMIDPETMMPAQEETRAPEMLLNPQKVMVNTMA